MPPEIVENTFADLAHLAGELNEKADDHSLRRSSAILRRLLVDDELGKAWRADGRARQPTIRAATLSRVLSKVVQRRVVVAAAGGAHYQSVAMMGMLTLDYALPDQELKAIRAQGLPRIDLPLTDYVASTTMVVSGQAISRRLLIKYVANKLGGAHHDPQRRPDKEETPYRLLDHVRAHYELAGKNAVYFELLAISQAVTTSPAIREWLGWPPAEGPFASA